jgi:hypothetical protein
MTELVQQEDGEREQREHKVKANYQSEGAVGSVVEEFRPAAHRRDPLPA